MFLPLQFFERVLEGQVLAPLECEVKWALESITTNKASGGDGIPVELFQILKDDAVKVLQSICQQIWKTQKWTQDWKNVSFHSNLQKGQCQRMYKLPYHSSQLMCQQDYAQNPSKQVAALCELRISRCTSWILKRQRNQRSNCQHSLDYGKGKGFPNQHLLLHRLH